MKKAFKIFGISLGSAVGLMLAVMIGYAALQPVIYADYYADAKKEFASAGLSDGVVPQGFYYIESKDLFLQCGYMADGESPSRIYIFGTLTKGRYVYSIPF